VTWLARANLRVKDGWLVPDGYLSEDEAEAEGMSLVKGERGLHMKVMIIVDNNSCGF
jgi:hypothetical protein